MHKDTSSSFIKKNCLYGFIFISIVGTLSHFLFHFSGENTIVGLFVPINESVWEHLKMIFWPIFFFSIFTYFRGGSQIPNFFLGLASGIIVSEVFILAFFYGYNAILGKEILVLDIISFFIGAGLCQYINYRVCLKEKFIPWSKSISIILIIIMIAASTVFTFNPPRTELFHDGPTDSYGINRDKV